MSDSRVLRIAFWAGSFERAGTQRFLLELLKRLDRSRFEPVVMSTLRTGELLPEIERLGIDVLEYGTGSRLLSPGTFAGVSRAVRFLRKERIDILSGMLGIVTLIGPFVGRLAGVPVVVNNQRNMGYWMRSGLRRRVYGFVNRRLVDAVLVNAAEAARELEERFGVPARRIVDVGIGVDLTRFEDMGTGDGLRSELGLGVDRVVTIVAKLSRVKGHDHFLEAAAAVATACTDVTFLIVGDGTRRRELEEMVVRLGLRDRVVFAGAREDVPEILAVTDVLVLSSLSEGSPNALLEGMAAGVPIVATAVGGVPDIVREGETGHLVPPGDGRALGEAMLRLVSQPELAERMGRTAREIAQQQYDIGRVVERYEEALVGLMAKSTRGRAETG